MQTLEISGKSLDEAKKAAAARLGVSVDALSVTVLEETKGLFGKGSVRIRAEAAAAAEAEPAAEAKVADEPKKPASRARAPKATKPEKAEKPPKVEKAREPAPEPVAAASDEGVDEGEAPQATADDADAMATLVRDALSTAGLQVTVNVKGIQSRYVNLELDGRDVAFLIGKHGEVLNAMQYLVNIIASRQIQNGVRATLDGNNYRRRREEALTGLALKIADQVKQRGEEAVLDALPAFERRIVHKALSEHSEVTTYSEGEEPNRRVVIAPAD
jgi:spoIIIJ-associated protein